ncbi:hypothetical protein [Reinekea sp.]|jgi:hypothetical protein|uniref:hypothetical protein n=1 Tax=Reinekea sp. TaxID=1970455 RepID=UPI002A7FC285|nr:hypothetical protein [Reinekea sp.]
MKSTKVDAFTQHTLSNIKPEVFKTLNLVQLEAIRQAISANAPFRQHPIDIRVALPLFFVKFYFVFLIGQDNRSDTRARESLRRTAVKGMMFVLILYGLVALSIPVIFFLLYAFKSLIGIDLFADRHLGDFL